MEALQGLVRGRALTRSSRGRDVREAAGISLRELAALIDVDVATLSRWERGCTARPRGNAARRWADAVEAISQELAAEGAGEPVGGPS